MTQRIAQLDLDRLSALNRKIVPEFVSPTASETSLLGLLRQRFSSDEDLVEQLQSGNADALTVLFHRHSALLFGIAKRILRNEAEAEDAVQQIFLDVYRAIQQFDREKGSFKTWLLMFTYHRTFNSRRSQTASRFFDTDPLDEGIASINNSIRHPLASPPRTSLRLISMQLYWALQRHSEISMRYKRNLHLENSSCRS